MEENNKNLTGFPKDFLWGAATSAHQVEGGTKNNWTQWEKENAERLAREAKKKWQPWQQEKFPEMLEKENYISGQACDHYNRYAEDFDLAKAGGHNAHRFSLEWSRIEPEKGKFDEKEIEHYRNVILALRERGMEPFVTLWHWTEPIWFNEQGGWTNKKSIEYFVRFVEKVVSEYKDIVKFWIVMNEPNVGLGFGYFLGTQPPAQKNPFLFIKAYFNLLSAHKKAYAEIHKINPEALVGNALSFMVYQSSFWLPIAKMLVFFPEYFSKYFARKTMPCVDFIGCNYYKNFNISLRKEKLSKKEINDLGWSIYPKGIYDSVMSLKKYNLPIYITENGLADADDSKRPQYIKDHLTWLHKAIEEGVNVKGYFHWSLLDNFEFPDVRGFWPRFGLVEVDFKTLERKPRQSFYVYQDIIKNNKEGHSAPGLESNKIEN
jgi:beta-glucosidase